MFNIFYLEEIIFMIVSYVNPKYTYAINKQWNLITKKCMSNKDILIQCLNMVRINDINTFERVHRISNYTILYESLKCNRLNFVSYLSKIPFYKTYINQKFISSHLQDELLSSIKLNNLRKFNILLSIDYKYDFYQCLRTGIDRNRLLMIKRMLNDPRFDPSKSTKLYKLASFNKNTNMINLLFKHNALNIN
jgi:hypothetical protein